VDKENDKGQESVYATTVKAGRRRTYFFDVRQTKGEDYYVTLTESTRRYNGDGYTRHKLFLYKEDFNRFIEALQDVVSHVKTELMPDYDYEQFDRKQEEWEKAKREAAEAEANATTSESTSDDAEVEEKTTDLDEITESDEDIDW